MNAYAAALVIGRWLCNGGTERRIIRKGERWADAGRSSPTLVAFMCKKWRIGQVRRFDERTSRRIDVMVVVDKP